ncbi:MAG: GC-type dockerin domain-anchored protein [Planctomycetota bacterium]
MNARTIAAAGALAGATLTHAQTDVELVGVLTETSSTFEAFGGGDFLASLATLSIPEPMGSFTQDFSTIGEATFTATFQAPEGYFIRLEPPADAIESNVSFKLDVGINTHDGAVDGVVTPELGLVLTGAPVPAIESFMFLSGPGPGAGIFSETLLTEFVPGETYFLTHISVSMNVPADFAAELGGEITRLEAVGAAMYDAFSNPADPGQWVWLWDICPPDVNLDGMVTPADFNAWVIAFNNQSLKCDQNGDGECTPADFNAWIFNFNNSGSVCL